MTIYKVNEDLSPKDKIKFLNSMILELNGQLSSGSFNKNEIDELYSASGYSRRYLRDVVLGNTVSTYTDWTHFKSEDGYSIWKITPSDYQHDSTNQLYFDDKVLENRGSAASESATSFSKVFIYDGTGETYTDNSTEAATETGTEFSLMDSTSDYLYIGSASTFGGIKFELHTKGSNYTTKVEYWNGGWVQLTANTNLLSDTTSNFISDGRISFTEPSDWVTTSINGSTLYWVRISTTSTPVNICKGYYIIPSSCIAGLLALSNEQIQKEQWCWGFYNNVVYVTIRNTGNTSYEGDYYITSSSTATNKENFFVHNHEYKSNYENINSVSQEITDTFSAASGVTIVLGDVVYISGSYELSLAVANSSTKFAHAIASGVNDTEITLVNRGIMKNVNTVGAGDILAGESVYLSTTDGKVIRNSSSGYTVFQRIGTAISNESGSKVDILLDLQSSPVVL